jgi:uncharacterized damage-inducible protein DinB
MAADIAGLAKKALIGELEGLAKAVRELAAPLSARDFWTKPIEPGNSFGHLVLHLTGNLNHFVGAQLGGTGYVREREREFTEASPPSKDEALTRLDGGVALFRGVVEGLDAQRLATPHPETRFGTVLETLLHLVAHFALHRGQMSYLVRLIVGRADKSAGH